MNALELNVRMATLQLLKESQRRVLEHVNQTLVLADKLVEMSEEASIANSLIDDSNFDRESEFVNTRVMESRLIHHLKAFINEFETIGRVVFVLSHVCDEAHQRMLDGYYNSEIEYSADAFRKLHDELQDTLQTSVQMISNSETNAIADFEECAASYQMLEQILDQLRRHDETFEESSFDQLGKSLLLLDDAFNMYSRDADDYTDTLLQIAESEVA